MWDAPETGAKNVSCYEILLVLINQSIRSIRTKTFESSISIQNIDTATVRQVSVRAVFENTTGPCSNTLDPMYTIIRGISFASKPELYKKSPTWIGIRFQKPIISSGDIAPVNKFVVQLFNENKDQTSESDVGRLIESNNFITTDVHVTPNLIYYTRIVAVCGSHKIMSKLSDAFKLEATSTEIVKEKIYTSSTTYKEGKPHVSLVNRHAKRLGNSIHVHHYDIGKSNPATVEKVIMLVGATGSGKTTLINGLLNFIYDVDWKDTFRLILIGEETGSQSQSQTKYVTAYTIHHQPGFRVPFTVTIIDTPGFGDTSGVLRDREITDEIRNFFTTKDGSAIPHIDCVGFVAQSSLPRLTPTQKYIFEQILALFGNDIEENIFLLLTFADGQKPQVLSGINEARLPYQKYFKFNNSALYAKNEISSLGRNSSEEKFDEMFWDMGMKSCQQFMDKLKTVESKSLLLTKEVLKERNQIQVHILGIQNKIRIGLNKLEIIEKEKKTVEQHQADIDANKNFTYTVEEDTVVKKDIPVGQHITNCLKCNSTCHELCHIADDEKKAGCWAMSNGYCRICNGYCHWTTHKNMRFKLVIERQTKQKTYDDLRKRYEEAGEKKLTAEAMMDKIEAEFKLLQVSVMADTEEVRRSIEHLEKIALRPNPLSTVDYVDTLIEAEKAGCEPGWRERTQQLQKVRAEVVWMRDIAMEHKDPFEQYKKKLDGETKGNCKKKMKKVIQKLKNAVCLGKGSDSGSEMGVEVGTEAQDVLKFEKPYQI